MLRDSVTNESYIKIMQLMISEGKKGDMISGRGNNVFFSRCVQINSSPNQPLAH
jgi:hypothetical protein